MADTSPRPVAAAVPAAADVPDRTYADWPAIFAGAVLATAIAFLLTSFGSAIGLSLVHLIDGERSAIWAAIAVGLWVLWVAVSSFMAGAYVTGRLRRRLNDATPHEVDIRDGIHGLVMWGVAALLGAVMTFASLSGLAGAGAAAVSAAGSAAASVVEGVADNSGVIVDRLFRGEDGRVAVPSGMREEVGRLLADSPDGVAEDDQAYLAGLVAERTGLPEEEANARIAALNEELAAAAQAAEDAAKLAQRVGVISAFLIAVSLLVGAAGAWWAAGVGGRHRDEGLDLGRMWFTHRVRRP
jgi:hypothetical protein